jgi:RNA polymerase sigma-70 factor (ECF subfamily)
MATALGAASATEPDRLAGLFDTHHQRLYRLARRMATTAEDAKDLVQETFLRVARSPGTVPLGACSEEAWLVRILINLCRDGWRRKATRVRAEDKGFAAVQPAATSSHESAFIAHQTIWRALHALAPRRRAVIVLHELEGLDARAIAHMLGVSAVTVRWHLSTGRRDLARVIGKGTSHD